MAKRRRKPKAKAASASTGASASASQSLRKGPPPLPTEPSASTAPMRKGPPPLPKQTDAATNGAPSFDDHELQFFSRGELVSRENQSQRDLLHRQRAEFTQGMVTRRTTGRRLSAAVMGFASVVLGFALMHPDPRVAEDAWLEATAQASTAPAQQAESSSVPRQHRGRNRTSTASRNKPF